MIAFMDTGIVLVKIYINNYNITPEGIGCVVVNS
jgi:hypothetical protein